MSERESREHFFNAHAVKILKKLNIDENLPIADILGILCTAICLVRQDITETDRPSLDDWIDIAVSYMRSLETDEDSSINMNLNDGRMWITRGA
jgi:hypothetical protein